MFQRIVAAATAAALALIDWGSRSAPRALVLVVLVALLAFIPGYADLPVTDRDEGRYVMATKQMLETGDFIDIRNQDLPRYKQPAGIYWLQALAVTVAGDGTASAIGAYRLPSLIGAVAASMLAWWSFAPLVGRRAALLGAMLLATSLLLGVEARIAKTDAALLATTMLGMGVLVRAFLDPRAVAESRLGFLFWVAIGLGAMIKGPITLLVLAVGAAALSVLARSVRWLGALRPGWGILIALAIALPWYVAITIRSEGSFFATALGWNALGKVTDVHQGHGGPPGLYSALVWVTFWPAAPILAAALGWIWANRRRREVLALLALIVPLWIVFEAVATKLPHYVLPTYPALAMLVALALSDLPTLARGWWSRLITHGFWLLPAGMLAAGIGLSVWFEGGLPWLAIPILAAAVALGAVATAMARRASEAVVPVAVAAALVTWLGTWPMVAALDTFWPSPRMAAAVERAATPACPDPRVATAGYHEPSFVFLTATDTFLAGSGAAAADFLAEGGCRLAFVDASPGRRGQASDESVFLARLGELGRRAEQVEMVEGRNLNGARLRRMGLWRLAEAPR
jgi:4-amino-4-deoxy-L-arabinose transferase-like glycosyltransferase